VGDAYVINIATANIHYPSATDMDILIAINGGASATDGDNAMIDWVRAAQSY
jgi:hypothetical protein